MQKTVALFGGSYNPPHEGHIQMGSYIQKALSVDETWMLFSVSPDKNPSQYAPLEDRMKMADILVQHYNAPLVLSDMEDQITKETGRYETYHVLEGMRKKLPDHKFVWVMGADSFAGFHDWKERDEILQNYIVAVVDRPGYTEKALTSPTAVKFAENMIDITNPDHLNSATNGWCFLHNPQIDASSTEIMRKLQNGETDFSEPFNQVASYIFERGLYGIKPSLQS